MTLINQDTATLIATAAYFFGLIAGYLLHKHRDTFTAED